MGRLMDERNTLGSYRDAWMLQCETKKEVGYFPGTQRFIEAAYPVVEVPADAGRGNVNIDDALRAELG